MRNDFFVTINAPGRPAKTYSDFTGLPHARKITVATVKKSGTAYEITP
jgi:hypothetical protein